LQWNVCGQFSALLRSQHSLRQTHSHVGFCRYSTDNSQLSASLYSFIDDARSVDTTVTGLCDELLGLSRVLDAISKSWKQNTLITIAQTDPDGDLWVSVKSSLDDCKSTLEKFKQKLDEVNGNSFLGRGFLRRPTKQIKLNMMMTAITAFRNQVNSYNSGMQSALQMINVCLLLQNQSSQDSVNRVLEELKRQLTRMEGTLQARGVPESKPKDPLTIDPHISSNLRHLINAAKSFHSSASTVVAEGSRSTVWGGSILGDPLSREQFEGIENWIPPPTVKEEEVDVPVSPDTHLQPESSVGRGKSPLGE